MFRTFLAGLAAVALVGLAAGPSLAGPETLAEAQALAAKQNKPLLIDFFVDNRLSNLHDGVTDSKSFNVYSQLVHRVLYQVECFQWRHLGERFDLVVFLAAFSEQTLLAASHLDRCTRPSRRFFALLACGPSTAVKRKTASSGRLFYQQVPRAA